MVTDSKHKLTGPIIFIPTHKSYLDFLIISYVLNFFKTKVPFIAAADDMAGITGVQSLDQRRIQELRRLLHQANRSQVPQNLPSILG
jgi:hypothetical protein